MSNLLSNIKVCILRIYVFFIDMLPKYSSSQKFWNKNIVDSPKNGFSSLEKSLNHLNWRNTQYINSISLMNYQSFNKKVILEYGCGPGNDLINMNILSEPKKIFAYDVSTKAINLARKRTKLHNLDINFILGDENQTKLPLKDNSIDIINSQGVLHHIENLKYVFKEFKRILNNKGYIQVMVYNKNSLWFHLHVAYEMKLKKKLWKNKSLENIFKKTTDGFRCPVAKCYTSFEFISLCKENGFNCSLIGVSTSLFEMRRINLIWEALQNKNLNNESRNFLRKIEFASNGEPMFNKQVAGINSYYKLTLI